MPTDQAAGVEDQAVALQQLRSMLDVAKVAGTQELSAEQWQELTKTLESLQSSLGVGNSQALPPGLQADPTELGEESPAASQQLLREMLRNYARSRNLPLPESGPKSRSPNPFPFPLPGQTPPRSSSQQDDGTGTPRSRRSARDRQSGPQSKPQSSPRQSGSTDARNEDMGQLSEGRQSYRSLGTDAFRSLLSPTQSPTDKPSNTPERQRLPNGTADSANKPQSLTGSKAPSTNQGKFDEVDPEFDRWFREQIGETTSDSSAGNAEAQADPSPGLSPGRGLPNPQDLRWSPSSSLPGNAGQAREALSSDATPNGSSSRQSPKGSTSISDQVSRFGLGATLRKLVEETIEEQGASAKDNSIIQSITDLAKSRGAPSKPSGNQSRSSNASSQPRANRGPDLAAGNSSGSTSMKSSGSAESGGVSSLVASAWSTIARAPSATSAAEATNAERGATRWTFQWTSSMTYALVALIAIVMLVIWLASKPNSIVARLINPSPSTRVRKPALPSIKSREDIVFAFHELVLHHPFLANDWWNHRFLVQQLGDSVADRRAALEEFAKVYEYARYLPPNAELTPLQLERAQEALNRCLAVGA